MIREIIGSSNNQHAHACLVALPLLFGAIAVPAEGKGNVVMSEARDPNNLKAEFAKARVRFGPCSWSAMLQKQTQQEFAVVMIFLDAKQKYTLLLGLRSLLSPEPVLEGNSSGLLNGFKVKVISDCGDQQLNNLINYLRGVKVGLEGKLREYLEGDIYQLDIASPPVLLSIRFNGIESHDSEIARLIDQIIKRLS